MLVMTTVPASEMPWQTYRDVRLRALSTDPEAFGSSSERERAFDEERWRERASNPGTFLWFSPGSPTSTDGASADEASADRASSGVDQVRDSSLTPATPRADGLIGLLPASGMPPLPDAATVRATYGAPPERLAFVMQMWVAPDHRGSGAFDDLMDAVIARARATGIEVMALAVYRDNVRAAAAYRRRGFSLMARPPWCPPDEDEYVLPLV